VVFPPSDQQPNRLYKLADIVSGMPISRQPLMGRSPTHTRFSPRELRLCSLVVFLRIFLINRHLLTLRQLSRTEQMRLLAFLTALACSSVSDAKTFSD